MPSAVSAVAYARYAGVVIDARSCIAVETHRGATLLIVVEPVEHTPRGFELAGLALRTIRDHFSLTHGHAPGFALERAMQIANATLVGENRPLAGCRWERRVTVGATAVVIHDRDAYIAQYPPSQAVLIQGDRQYAFPELASWRSDWVPETDDLEPSAMGLDDAARPQCFRTSLSVGDLVVLASSTLGRALGRDPWAAPFADELLGAVDSDHGLDVAVAAADAAEVQDVAVLSVRVDHLPLISTHRTAPAAVASPGWGGRLAWRPGLLVARASSVGGSASALVRSGSASAAALPMPGLPLDGLRLPSLRWRRSRRTGVLPRTLRAAGTGRMERHLPGPAVMPEMLPWLPRGIETSISRRAVLTALTAILIVGGSALGYGWVQHRERTGSAAIAQADQAITLAINNPVAAAPALEDAEAALDAAARSGTEQALITSRWLSLEHARDRAWGITRLGEPQLRGAVPASVMAADPQLVSWGYHGYLIGDGVYEIAEDGTDLIELLAPGQLVQGMEVGPILAGGASDTGLVVTDGTSLLRWNGTGKWVRSPLLDANSLSWNGVDVAAFNGTLYRLADGTITKLVSGPAGVIDSEWASAADASDLLEATDFVVGERVSVLLEDGRILTFYTGVLEQSDVVPIVPEISGGTFLASAGGSPSLWIVEPAVGIGGSEGRLIQYDRGGIAAQYTLPSVHIDPEMNSQGRAAFSAPDAVAVSELAKTVYVLQGNEIWTIPLP